MQRLLQYTHGRHVVRRGLSTLDSVCTQPDLMPHAPCPARQSRRTSCYTAGFKVCTGATRGILARFPCHCYGIRGRTSTAYSATRGVVLLNWGCWLQRWPQCAITPLFAQHIMTRHTGSRATLTGPSRLYEHHCRTIMGQSSRFSFSRFCSRRSVDSACPHWLPEYLESNECLLTVKPTTELRKTAFTIPYAYTLDESV